MKIPYTYTILRYMHDVSVGESLNVGVVLAAPSKRFLAAKFQPNYGRLRKLFPSLEGTSHRHLIRYLQKRFDEVQRNWSEELDLVVSLGNAVSVAQKILPRDDSSFQWSPMGSGLSHDPARTLNDLYDRFVTINDSSNLTEGRSDDAVWSIYKAQLANRKILSYFSPHKVTTSNDEVEFDFAWKNHNWHCLEPFSLDLVDTESIKNKAHRLLGQMYGVRDAVRDYNIYLMVGESHRENCKATGQKVLNLLFNDLPVGKTEIIREHEAEDFSRSFAQKISEHYQAGDESIVS